MQLGETREGAVVRALATADPVKRSRITEEAIVHYRRAARWYAPGNGYVTRYAHNSDLQVKAGDHVSGGQLIAQLGQLVPAFMFVGFLVGVIAYVVAGVASAVDLCRVATCLCRMP